MMAYGREAYCCWCSQSGAALSATLPPLSACVTGHKPLLIESNPSFQGLSGVLYRGLCRRCLFLKFEESGVFVAPSPGWLEEL